jgi:hypothetical protein
MAATFKIFINLILILYTSSSFAQNKYEREFRIKKSQFPTTAKDLLDTHVKNIKRLKFYKETDSTKNSYEAKFKKDKLWYGMGFEANGALKDIKIIIKPLDIPSDALSNITVYLNKSFDKHRVKIIHQQYVISAEEKLEKSLRNAFQNLLLPSLNYEIIVIGKKDKDYLEYKIRFDAEGDFIAIKKRLPPNYDRVLY